MHSIKTFFEVIADQKQNGNVIWRVCAKLLCAYEKDCRRSQVLQLLCTFTPSQSAFQMMYRDLFFLNFLKLIYDTTCKTKGFYFSLQMWRHAVLDCNKLNFQIFKNPSHQTKTLFIFMTLFFCHLRTCVTVNNRVGVLCKGLLCHTNVATLKLPLWIVSIDDAT